MHLFFDFCVNLLVSLSEQGEKLVEFMGTYPSLSGVPVIDYTFGEILFGVGIPIFIGYAAVSFVIDILP